MKEYMKEKNLKDARLEFKCQTNMLDSRTTMKGKYKNTVFPVCCPHCPEGRSVGVPENPAHWLQCLAYRDLIEGSDPELVRTVTDTSDKSLTEERNWRRDRENQVNSQ